MTVVPLADFGLIEPLLGEGVPRRHLIVSSDLADAQVVVSKDFVAALLLNLMMGLQVRQRTSDFSSRQFESERISLAGQATVADVVDEAIDLLRLGTQYLSVVEIVIPVLSIWQRLENH
ncbi:hypothetical protein GGD66_006377 [Bradyrhizobium sp. CIR48]|uniref:hypothetical protein n=1 Tax=Bradyrhizobium sp. CIR48 TaxID=2663840 RepID=UPI0016061CF1|nr:hypothetical protein [Bradyrhizobium sp. CIR48]MBB4427794.1 hypothetical protein [Bradyrhizobium sp. CIR48]